MIEFVGFSLDVLGKLMVAYTAVRVHYRFWKEHQIDERVFQEMRRERNLGMWGIGLIIIGYIIQAPFFFL